MANNVRVTELDFETIKENLKTYLRAQSQFTDYDFDASNLSVLIDLLSYNTHYNAVLANMVSNEMFLDSAIKRSSVVSLAKQLGYLPRSRKAATSTVNVVLQNILSKPNFLTINPFTLFTTTIDGTSYNFYNTVSYTTTPNNEVYTFSNVKLYQGRILEYYFTVGAGATPATKYVIPNLDIDTDTIAVAVQYGGVGSYDETFIKMTDITEVDSTTKVFYLQENTEGYYEIFFGDDVLGVALSQNDVIKVRYLITDGDAANVSDTLAVSWSVNAIAGETTNDRTITTVSKPSGGSDKEDIDTIRFRSINNYASQGRAVTANDYSTIISDRIPGVESVNVWGGEKNDPPVYGKTFISVKPKTGYVLTDTEKEYIINDILKPRSVVTAQHEFVDPTYTYVGFDVTVRYSSAQTTQSADDIRSLVNTKITTFMNTNLSRFNANFYRSQLEEQIMDLDDAILSVNVVLRLQKRLPLTPRVRYSGSQIIQFPAKFHPNEIRSSYFYFNDETGDGIGYHPAQVRDVPDESPPDYEGTGTLKTFDLDSNAILDANVGTVYYGQGKIVLNSESPLTVYGYIGNETFLYANTGLQETASDIFPNYNEILVLDDSAQNTVAGVSNGINIDVIAVNN